jgi:hypothetical protein
VAGIPPELIFVLVFVAFSVLDGIGRKKKAERKGAPGTVPGPQRRSVQNRETVATIPPEPASSEEIIPGDVWEEILGLARGTSSEPDRVDEPVDEPVEEPEEETSWTAFRTEGQTPDSHAPELKSLAPRPERVQSMPDRGRAPSVHARPSGKEGARAKGAERKESSVRQSLLGDGSTAELRKAFILKEVLGPPVSLKG